MNKNGLIIDFLNVGFGESICIRSMGDPSLNILVDGGDNRSEIFTGHQGRMKLSEYIKKERIASLDLLIISHFHRDHCAGIRDIIADCIINEVWVNYLAPQEFWGKKINTSNNNISWSVDIYNDIFRMLSKKGTEFCLLDNDRLYVKKIADKTLRIKGLTPDKSLLRKLNQDMETIYRAKDQNIREEKLKVVDQYLNQTSIAAIVEYDGVGVLLTADLPLSFWERFKNTNDLQVTLMKAPHHGDISNINEELLQLTGAQYLVVSADKEGTYNLPSPEIIDLAERRGVKVIYTENPFLGQEGERSTSEGVGFIRFTIEDKNITCEVSQSRGPQ